MDDLELDHEELDVLESLESGEWESVPNVKEEMALHSQYAKNTLKKDKRVNIRMSSRDLDDIQTIAIEDGIPYQTLMSSILHRFVTGKLVDKQQARG